MQETFRKILADLTITIIYFDEQYIGKPQGMRQLKNPKHFTKLNILYTWSPDKALINLPCNVKCFTT